ncbi:hypothetical protein AVEN_162157-1, partial [Araneus ventricosus]
IFFMEPSEADCTFFRRSSGSGQVLAQWVWVINQTRDDETDSIVRLCVRWCN